MKNIFFIVWLFFIFFAGSSLVGAEIAAFPSEYGNIIFEQSKESSSHIYIIGIGHRDTLTRVNGEHTAKAQMEVYKIGEWLIKNEGVDLVLPEGFFVKKDLTKNFHAAKVFLNEKMVKEELKRNDVYVNAEMLLKSNYGITLKQVEDEQLYFTALEKVALLDKYENGIFSRLFIKLDFDYIQTRRTAAMLQNTPDVMDNAGKSKAILTIGLEHIPAIVKYLRKGQIEITSPAFRSYKDYSSSIKLLENNFGVTVIVPRSLVNLRITEYKEEGRDKWETAIRLQ